jgi:polyisoprenoid-binding protein YceI
MKKILLLLLSATAIFASQCNYDLKELKVDWKAYKTPLKIGVGGTFDNVDITATDKSSTKAFLQSATLTIHTASINSKNAGRDAKLVHYFFEKQNVKAITIKVLSVEKKIIKLAVTMNGITKTVPMKLDLEKDEAEAEGYIDLADFKMLPSLQSINKACYDLHQGKTWQDVEIEFELKTKKNCE